MRERSDRHGSVQDLLPLERIDRDIVRLRDGACRAVLETGSLGFALKSDAEQEAILAGYRAFLNGLRFPLQVLVRVQSTDIEAYLEGLRTQDGAGTSSAVARLALDHEAFVRRLARELVLLDRRFYIVVSVGGDAAEGTAVPPLSILWPWRHHSLTHDQQAAVMVRQLATRCDQVVEGLAALGLVARRLVGEELTALWYSMLAPDRARLQPLPSFPGPVRVVSPATREEDHHAR
jgi:hypothetical protein